MSTPNSVTGPDRRPGTDALRRGSNRRAEGGDEFGSALSAELKTDRRQATDKQADRNRQGEDEVGAARAQDRATQNRITQDRITQHRITRSKADQARTAEDRDRAGVIRATRADSDRTEEADQEASREARPEQNPTTGTGVPQVASQPPAPVAATGSGGSASGSGASGPAAVTGRTASAPASETPLPVPANAPQSAAEPAGETANNTTSAPATGQTPGPVPGTPVPAGSTPSPAGRHPDAPATPAAGELGAIDDSGPALTGPALTDTAAQGTGNQGGATPAAGARGGDVPGAGADRAGIPGTSLPAAAGLGEAALTESAAQPTDQPAPRSGSDAPPVAAAAPGTTDDASTGQNTGNGDQSGPGTPNPIAQPELPVQADVSGTTPVVGPATTGVAPATGPAAPAAAAPPPPSTPMPGPPAIQLATRIAPLRLDADGVHRLTVNLHPADLGPVQVVAEIRSGSINVQLSGATDAGHDALRNAMDDLRRELEQSGFSNTTLDLRQGSNQQDQARQQFGFLETARAGNGSSASASAINERAAAGPTAPRPPEDGRLDIQA